MKLTVTTVGHGQFCVTGGKERHWVDLVNIDTPQCDCADYLWRDRECKHIKAAKAQFEAKPTPFHVKHPPILD